MTDESLLCRVGTRNKTVLTYTFELLHRHVKAKRVVLASIDVNDLPVIEISDSEDEDASTYVHCINSLQCE